jgi:tetratricopeptide (TPR) repeat protein
MNMRESDRAAADFEQATRLAPKLTAPYVNLGSVYAKKNELDRAISYYTQAIQIYPKHTFALAMRGSA